MVIDLYRSLVNHAFPDCLYQSSDLPLVARRGALTAMDSLWSEFRAAPTLYLQARRSSKTALLHAMLQTLAAAEEKNDTLKLTILGIFQEMAPMLLGDADRLENAISTLKTVFQQQRSTLSVVLTSQIICTLTTLVIEMEEYTTSHSLYLVELVILLFDVIEKVKSEANRLLKATACECLRELEVAYPGLLCAKVGHFYGMSQAENSYIHQSYMALFAVTLKHTVQKFLLQQQAESSPSITPDHSLQDLLSYSDPLKSYRLPDGFREQAELIRKQGLTPVLPAVEGGDFHEVKRGVSFILEHLHLLTPACLTHTTLTLVSCVQQSQLAPRMLKGVMLRYSSCQDPQLFHLVLLLRLRLGADICDEGDEETLRKWLLLQACQPTLSRSHRGLLWEWLLHWPPHEEGGVEGGGGEEGEGGRLLPEDHRPLEETQRKALLPLVFDSLDLFCYKMKALCTLEHQLESPEAMPTMMELVLGVFRLVESGVGGAPAVAFYRAVYTHYSSHQHASQGAESGRLILDLVKQHPKFIPHTIDFISSVQQQFPSSPLPLNLLSSFTQYLLSLSLPSLLSQLPRYLLFVKHAASHPRINPVVLLQLISRVAKESSLCVGGSWEVGSTMLDVCNTVMRVHHTEAVFRDLSELLQLISESYSDIDIRDRAQFYHQLLLTVSGSKLSAILTLASDSVTGASLADIVEARISDSVFPSAPPVQKISSVSSFLTLEKLEGSGGEVEGGSVEGGGVTGEEEDEGEMDGEAILREYRSALQSVAKGQVPVRLSYRIRYIKRPESVSQRIYAVVLKLSTDAPYRHSPEVYVPCLECEANGASTTFKKVTLTFFPQEPVPAEFSVSALFSTEDGVTCSTLLEPISVTFRDLFQPLLPQALQRCSAEVLFPLLWDYIERTQHPGPHSSSQAVFGARSTMHLPLGAADWERSSSSSSSSSSSQVLQAMTVPRTATDYNTGIRCVLVYLPPLHHLLLRLQLSADSTTAHIATDNWKLLPLITGYLQGLS